MASPLHVAIVGGGITGLVLAIGLQARGIPFTLYERAAGFSEFGAGIGFSPNAEVAMQLLSPALHAAFKEAVTPNGQDYFQWVDGYTTDKVMYRLHLGKDGFQGGRRSDILQAWAALVPADNVQFRKELVALVNDGGGKGSPVQLRFADGTTATADVVIGADGVWSRMRSLLFGDAYRAAYSHHFCFRAVVPMDEARTAIGDERASSRFMYNGYGAHAITYPVAMGAMLNVLVVIGDPNPWRAGGSGDSSGIAGREASTEDGRPPTSDTGDIGSASEVSRDSSTANRQTTGRGRREDAEHAFAKWQACARGVVSLLPEAPDRWAIFDMLENPVASYNRGRVALAGDAAHASGPHLGAGAGFGIEDALVLATLLGNLTNTSPNHVTAALEAYSKVRYERTQWLVQASRDAVKLFEWQDAAQGHDADVFGREITWCFHKIWNYDLAGMVVDARNMYEAAVGDEAKVAE